MKISSAGFLSLAIFCLTNAAFAGGAYQKTQDGKSLVWNTDPKPGDSATWSGRRDESGYATGRGTLTWFHAQRKIVTGSNLAQPKYIAIASYTGEMVKGKLNGAVAATDSNGKKYHGTYADGRRTKWIAGAAKENSPNEPMSRRGELIEEPAEGPGVPVAEVKTTAPKNQPDSETAPVPQASPAKKTNPEFDDSLRSLVGPPTVLRTNPDPNARSTSSSPGPNSSAAHDTSSVVSPSPGASVAPSPQ